ncbi:MAG: DNA primase, partial [Acidobacteria bacterium]|nr:DNA primase [Acidobacteriota bacterium]
MSGRIRDTDVSYVRDHSPIDEVVGDYVQLKSAGGGQKKGLCPFHDEKSPSFHVTPARGYFHCFGCQEGGDVIAFIMKIDHLSFTETIERLASRIGYQLTYEQSSGGSKAPTVQRSRLLEANSQASLFYQEQLQLPTASHARELLIKRGFDKTASQSFEIGYAPDQWDALSKFLLGKGFSAEELLLAGLTKEGTKGAIDRFRNRLIWPIRDISGDLVG